MHNTVLDLSAYVALVAVGCITLNFLLGTLMVFRYSPVRQWPHRRLNYFHLHRVTGYSALSFALLHPVILLFNKADHFRVVDLLYPVHSPSQPLENSMGAVALYIIAVVALTSYARIRLGRRLWKSFHFTIYIAAAALLWHSIFTDPNLKNSRVDWLDSGKIFVAICALLIITMSALRYRHSLLRAKDR